MPYVGELNVDRLEKALHSVTPFPMERFTRGRFVRPALQTAFPDGADAAAVATLDEARGLLVRKGETLTFVRYEGDEATPDEATLTLARLEGVRGATATTYRPGADRSGDFGDAEVSSAYEYPFGAIRVEEPESSPDAAAIRDLLVEWSALPPTK